MGSIVGGIFGAMGASKASGMYQQAGQDAAKAALTGYKYATGEGKKYVQPYQQAGVSSNNMIAQLLGAAPMGEGTENAFQNYLNSTGYQFQLQQGMNAIDSNAAASGLLKSGGTAKALTKYGQNLASTSFNNYLTQLGALSQRGLGATGQVINAGTAGGGAAAGALMQGGAGAANAMGGMYSNIGSAVGGGINALFGM
jgi:hypothetical protein